MSISVILVRIRVMVRSQKVTKGHKIKKNNSDMRYMFSSHFYTYVQFNLPFANWPQESQRQVRVSSTPGHMGSKFWIDILELKIRVSESVWFQDSKKCHFYFCAISRNAPNRSLKKWRDQRILFFGYMLTKNKYINLKFGILYVQTSFYEMLCCF